AAAPSGASPANLIASFPEPATVPRTKLFNSWRYLGPLLAPVALVGLVVLLLYEPLDWWLHGEERYDREAINEWLWEAGDSKTLPEVVREYLNLVDQYRKLVRVAQGAPLEQRE